MKRKPPIQPPSNSPDRPQVVESTQAAASILGYRKDAIQAARNAGCSAFKPGNRIDLLELEEWFALHPEVVSVNEGELAIEQALRLETISKALMRREAYAKVRRTLIRLDEMRIDGTRAALAFRAELWSMASSVSQKLALMTDANKIDVELRGWIRRALEKFHKLEWVGCNCPHCGKEITKGDLK